MGAAESLMLCAPLDSMTVSPLRVCGRRVMRFSVGSLDAVDDLPRLVFAPAQFPDSEDTGKYSVTLSLRDGPSATALDQLRREIASAVGDQHSKGEVPFWSRGVQEGHLHRLRVTVDQDTVVTRQSSSPYEPEGEVTTLGALEPPASLVVEVELVGVVSTSQGMWRALLRAERVSVIVDVPSHVRRGLPMYIRE